MECLRKRPARPRTDKSIACFSFLERFHPAHRIGNPLSIENAQSEQHAGSEHAAKLATETRQLFLHQRESGHRSRKSNKRHGYNRWWHSNTNSDGNTGANSDSNIDRHRDGDRNCERLYDANRNFNCNCYRYSNRYRSSYPNSNTNVIGNRDRNRNWNSKRICYAHGNCNGITIPNANSNL